VEEVGRLLEQLAVFLRAKRLPSFHLKQTIITVASKISLQKVCQCIKLLSSF
jgi:hypothetical protein